LNSHTSNKPNTRKAIALISGGLDSALAAALVKSWGIEVIALHLTSPFGCTEEAQRVAKDLSIHLIIKEKGESFVDMVKSPKYGYGSQMNPCVDCRIYMFDLAETTRLEQNADFIVTGEVVGQRPFSQNKAAMNLIDKISAMESKILRPLSGGNLPPTEPEQKGWIQRQDLFKFSGRGRREQLALAQKLGVRVYSSPGGGCLLTEKAFSQRLRDFYSYPTYKNSVEKMAQATLLRLGRHFRLSKDTKAIIARTDRENEELKSTWKKIGCFYFEPQNFTGPSAIAMGQLNQESKTQVVSILARYGRKTVSEPYTVETFSNQNSLETSSEFLSVTTPAQEEILNQWRVGIT